MLSAPPLAPTLCFWVAARAARNPPAPYTRIAAIALEHSARFAAVAPLAVLGSRPSTRPGPPGRRRRPNRTDLVDAFARPNLVGSTPSTRQSTPSTRPHGSGRRCRPPQVPRVDTVDPLPRSGRHRRPAHAPGAPPSPRPPCSGRHRRRADAPRVDTVDPPVDTVDPTPRIGSTPSTGQSYSSRHRRPAHAPARRRRPAPPCSGRDR